MAPQFRSIEERNAGREAMFEAEAVRRGDIRAGEINAAAEETSLKEQEQLQIVANAREKGIEEGSRAGAVDAAEMFAQQGFIPGQMAQGMRFFNDQENAMEEEQRGLQMSADSQDGAFEAQVDDISTKLLEATMQGAPDDVVNQTLDELQVPDQVKQAAAQMFLQKRQDVGSQDGGMDQDSQNLLAQFKAKPTENTQRAFGIVAETDERMAKLHELLSPPQQQQEQGGPQNG